MHVVLDVYQKLKIDTTLVKKIYVSLFAIILFMFRFRMRLTNTTLTDEVMDTASLGV